MFQNSNKDYDIEWGVVGVHISYHLFFIDHSTEGSQINAFTFTGTGVNVPAI